MTGSPDDFTGSPDDFTGSPDDFVRRLPRSPDDFQTTSKRLTGKSSQKSSRSKKPAYHIKKRSNGLKTEKISEKLDRYIFIEHTKYISKWKMRTI